MNPNDYIVASVDLHSLKFLLQHSETHLLETNFMIRNQNVLTKPSDQTFVFKAKVAECLVASGCISKDLNLNLDYGVLFL